MRNKIKLLLLAGDTFRARSYAQILAENSTSFSVEGYFYGSNKKVPHIESLSKIEEAYYKENDLFVPDFNQSVKITFEKNGWDFTLTDNEDVNSSEVISKVTQISPDIVVFAGFGGQILKPTHFQNKFIYLHMHPGDLPLERGSTTIYYSILNKRRCTVTAFLMTAKIDEGNNVHKHSYCLPLKGMNIDLFYDNIVRADCFIRALQKIKNKAEFLNDEHINNCEYFVIHPVLKHIALLSLKENE